MEKQMNNVVPEQSLQLRERLLEIKQCLVCAHEGTLVTQLDGNIIETSPAAEHILETPSLELKARNIRQFCTDRDSYDMLFAQASTETRALNRPVLVETTTGKKKILNMSMERLSQDGE